MSGSRELTPAHLLLGTLREMGSEADQMLSLLGANKDSIVAEVRSGPDGSPLEKIDDMALSNPAKRVIDLSFEEAKLFNQPIGTACILLGVLREGGDAAQVLQKNGVTLEAARAIVKEAGTGMSLGGSA